MKKFIGWLTSMNALTGTQAFAPGPLKDLTLDAGFILGSKNKTFASGKQAIVVGPNLVFNVPGNFDVALLYWSQKSGSCRVWLGILDEQIWNRSSERQRRVAKYAFCNG
ncbi:hypothetical protein [Paraburkholderia sp.]|uniref:hypothetical protein n=1 Tax=Paraburkholderia sp. TaxID=1926495 RepID=UPI002D2DCF72|nr:hypothetical protein [Paraburkholderia sp.]HZZ03916.1 hypothetical protein [Paraburkholderia sp.]